MPLRRRDLTFLHSRSLLLLPDMLVFTLNAALHINAISALLLPAVLPRQDHISDVVLGLDSCHLSIHFISIIYFWQCNRVSDQLSHRSDFSIR